QAQKAQRQQATWVPLTNVSPAPNETAGRRCRSVLRVGEGQARVAGLTRHLSCQTGVSLPTVTAPNRATRDIRPIRRGYLTAGVGASDCTVTVNLVPLAHAAPGASLPTIPGDPLYPHACPAAGRRVTAWRGPLSVARGHG